MIMSLLKAVFLGAILTFVVSGVIWAGQSTGGFLNIHEFEVQGHFIQWSWPMFITGTGLSWGIMVMMK